MRIKTIIYYLMYKFYRGIYAPIGKIEYCLRRKKYNATIKYVEDRYYQRPEKE